MFYTLFQFCVRRVLFFMVCISSSPAVSLDSRGWNKSIAKMRPLDSDEETKPSTFWKWLVNWPQKWSHSKKWSKKISCNESTLMSRCWDPPQMTRRVVISDNFLPTRPIGRWSANPTETSQPGHSLCLCFVHFPKLDSLLHPSHPERGSERRKRPLQCRKHDGSSGRMKQFHWAASDPFWICFTSSDSRWLWGDCRVKHCTMLQCTSNSPSFFLLSLSALRCFACNKPYQTYSFNLAR